MKMVDHRINSALYVFKVHTLQFLFSDPTFVSLIPGQTDATSPNIVADPTLTSVPLVWLPCCTMFHDAEWCWAKFGFHQISSSTSSNISFLLSCERQCCIPKKDEAKYHLRKKIIIITFASVFNIVERAPAHRAGFAGTCIHGDDLLIIFALRVAVWWGTCSSTMFDFTVWTFLLMVQSWWSRYWDGSHALRKCMHVMGCWRVMLIWLSRCKEVVITERTSALLTSKFTPVN